MTFTGLRGQGPGGGGLNSITTSLTYIFFTNDFFYYNGNISHNFDIFGLYFKIFFQTIFLLPKLLGKKICYVIKNTMINIMNKNVLVSEISFFSIVIFLLV